MDAMVDSCVLLDIFTEDEMWLAWSSRALAEQADRGMLVINAIIYAEISIRFAKIEKLESLLDPNVFDYRPLPREAAFLAGKCFLSYRRKRGQKTLPLPDFLIGAHAAVENLPLITRDTGRFRTYFPTLRLICPDGAQ